jgi:hypothetical protein
MGIIKNFYSNLSNYVDNQPLVGWLLLVILVGSLTVTVYQFSYHFGRFIANIL